MQTMMAVRIARVRDCYNYWAVFYATMVPAMVFMANKTHSPAPLIALVGPSFITAYLWDAGYGNKVKRIKESAETIMEKESDLLAPPKIPPNLMRGP